MYDLLIKNGKVVTASDTFESDIAIKEGKICGLGRFKDNQAKTVINAEGKYIMPGGIEAHMHCRAPFQGCLGAHTFFEQSMVAAYGGITTFMDFSNMSKGQSPYLQALDRLEEMSESCIDYSVHGKFVEATDEALADIQKLINIGIPTFKMFMTYKKEGVMCSEKDMVKIFKVAKRLKGLPMLHCESNTIAESNIEEMMEKGTLSWKDFPKAKPIACEVEAFSRAVALAEYVGNAVIIVHTTNGEALDIARQAHKKGLPIYVETGPHYLTLFDDLYDREDGFLVICSPPLRSKKESKELWKGIKDGTISLFGSDDCTFDIEEKVRFLDILPDGYWKQDFTKVVNGMGGIETRLSILLSEGVNKGRISLNKVCALTSTNIAKLYGCYPQKGVIAIGSDADLVIVDLDKEIILNKDNLHSKISYCLYDGMKIKGVPITTILRGNIIVDNGKFLGKKANGQVVHRSIDEQRLLTFESL